MSLCPPLEDIYITKKTNTMLEICYRNLHEPKKFQLYKMVLQRTTTEVNWKAKHIAIYNEPTKQFELIGSLYSNDLIKALQTELINHLKIESSVDFYKEKNIG